MPMAARPIRTAATEPGRAIEQANRKKASRKTKKLVG
jgi:hypothetical protein